MRARIEACAQAVLDARARYEGSTIADMYDPENDFLFPELAAAHAALDAAVLAAYGLPATASEDEIVNYLLTLHAQLTAAGE